MPAIIRARGIGKRYRLGATLSHNTLRDHLADGAKRLLRKGNRNTETTKQPNNDFWALRDVDFDIQEGEVVGIIGHNGAGKSTLLKILSQITEPTKGEIRIRGRVASLLEVGTGFHPELSGRENVFMNGAILGMSKAEIRSKFDEIVDFAGVEKFLDTPVKRYSSGMLVRLGFAVAAHLEPEILVVDEVLAVGDAEFQRKCLGKMEDVSKGGRTVLFVSHNMAAVQNLCPRSILLSDGTIKNDGETSSVATRYLASQSNRDWSEVKFGEPPWPTAEILRRFRITDQNSNLVTSIVSGQDLILEFEYSHHKTLHDAGFGIVIEDSLGNRLFCLQNRIQTGSIESLPARGVARCKVSSIPLAPGTYFLTLGISVSGQQVDHFNRLTSISVQPSDVYGTGRLPGRGQGPILVHADWNYSE